MPESLCPPGKSKCCEALERSDHSLVGNILALLGVTLEAVEGLVYAFTIRFFKELFLIPSSGIQCVPIDINGIGQNECHYEPVCCSGQDIEGLIAMGCSPININL
ncbi:hypothetical protein C0995_000599 [Termitomyces sp. Mi166|nr:hypothetical protein C0995_000599 [Termitomyces sp. Mi166\